MVEDLATSFALIAVRRLGPLQPGAPAQSDPHQHGGNGRDRHAKAFRDLCRRHPQTTQRRDRDADLVGGPPRHVVGPVGPAHRSVLGELDLRDLAYFLWILIEPPPSSVLGSSLFAAPGLLS